MSACSIALPGDDLPYDPDSVESVLAWAKQLEGKTLRQLIKERLPQEDADKLIAQLTAKSGRGQFGQCVEEGHFGYAANSKAEPDFGSMELKCTPLIPRKTGLEAKERIVICMINFGGDDRSKVPCVLDETFETSHAWAKLRKILLIHYEHKESGALDLPVRKASIWTPSDEERRIIKEDWEKIRWMVSEGRAHEISEGMTLLLGACTKAADGKRRTSQARSAEPAKPRAFALKQSFAQAIWESLSRPPQRNLPAMKEIDRYLKANSSFENWLLGKFRGFRNLTIEEICRDLHIVRRTDSLNQHAANMRAVLNVLLAGAQDKSHRNLSELRKTGLQIKTIRINSNGKPHQAVSFPAFDYQELAAEDSWEDSSLYHLFTRRFLLIFLHDDGDGECVFAKATFWSMPEKDLESCKAVWQMSVDAARRGEYHDMPGMKDHAIAHVRPHDQRGGPKMKRCYWLNKGYIERLWHEVKSPKA